MLFSGFFHFMFRARANSVSTECLTEFSLGLFLLNRKDTAIVQRKTVVMS